MADVTNYTIENASGANVRTDLNNVFAAIQSSNSKSTDLASSQCVAGMPFLNTTTNILKIRNSSNGAFTEIGNINETNLGLLSKAGGTMTGALLIDNSTSASTPALSFDGDTDLGLFRKSANVMGFSSSGTEQMTFDANGITLNNENEIRFSEGTSNGTNYITVKAPASVASNRTLTLPDETGTLLTSGTGIASTSVTGVLFALGSTSISRGDTVSTVKINTLQDESGNNASTTEQIAQGRAKIWCAFNQSTINDDFGVDSVTDNGTGNYTVNFTSNFSNTNYCAVVTGGNGTNSPCGVAIMEKTTSTIRITTTGMNVQINQLSDSSLTGLAIFAD